MGILNSNSCQKYILEQQQMYLQMPHVNLRQNIVKTWGLYKSEIEILLWTQSYIAALSFV